jgi:hypothetical protein
LRFTPDQINRLRTIVSSNAYASMIEGSGIERKIYLTDADQAFMKELDRLLSDASDLYLSIRTE